MTASITWGEGWASDFGGAPAPGDTPVPGTQRMGIALRSLISQATGIAATAVRPANQNAPADKTLEEFATVEVTSSRDLGQQQSHFETQPDGSQVQFITSLREITVSVNFYRGPSPKVDGQRMPTYTNGAFDRASRLEKRLSLTQFSELARSMGLGLLGASMARDLAAVVTGHWESRGQVDLYFSVVEQENSPLTIFSGAGPIGIVFDNPAGIQTTKTIP